MKADRRKFLSRSLRIAAAAPFRGSLVRPSSSTADDPQPSRIQVHLDRPTKAIDRMIYGLFAEHLGRCIYEGVYQEDSPLSDTDGYRKDVRQALGELRVPAIRWPGGFFASYYHWQDGVGPKASRPKKLNVPWQQTETNRFGTTEFIAYCRHLGAEPQIVVNCLTGTVEETLGWLEYCNLNTDTHYANLRRQHGQAEPFGVKYWELDIGIAFNEYNIVRDWGGLFGPADHRFELSFNLRDALWLATVLNAFQRHCDVVKCANYSELVNVVAPLRTNDTGMFRQTVYHTLQLYSRHCGSQLLETRVDTETFPVAIEPPDVAGTTAPEAAEAMPYLDVSATREDSTLSLIVTNLHDQKAIKAEVVIHGLTGRHEAALYEINGQSPDTENSFEEPNEVTLQRKENLFLERGVEYSFPTHSITLIKVQQ